jgi:hypothetical protein
MPVSPSVLALGLVSAPLLPLAGLSRSAKLQ